MYKVVVVEDEALVRRGIVMATDWQSLGCVVVGEAANGLEGLSQIRRLSPDIVVTDVRMPGLDGVGMIQALRDEGSATQFIILSAHSDFSYAQSAVKLGVADYLLKPFADGELEQAVQAIAKRLGTGATEEENGPPLLRLNVEKGGKSKYVELALEYVAEHYASPAISIAEVAEHLAISEGYLSRVFKKETSYTFNNYLTRFRMREAMRQLRDLRVKVYEVAEAVGYTDTTYFSTLFKKLVGCSPSEYQDRCH